MKIQVCAKINLGLNIVGKRDDGYHDLETVFYPVDIHDEIEILEGGDDCMLTVNGAAMEGDPEKNLVVKAYRLLQEYYSLPPVRITLTKNIPMQAGMGGGSADCGFTIRLLNEMFQLGMNTAQMQQYAARLGADCAFFITAEPSYAEGIGERLAPLPLDLSRYRIGIVKPPVAISTREAFAHIKVARPERCCRDVVMQPIETWKDVLTNDFEASIFPQHPELARIKEQLYDMGALYAAMSGSGSALFGIFAEAPCHFRSSFDGCFTALV